MQLGQTIAWCAPRVSADDPTNSLRTLLPNLIHTMPHVDLLMLLVEPVVQIRSMFLEAEYKIERAWKRPIPPLPSGLAGGQLLIFYPNTSVSDPAAGVESNGYFDWNTIPAWDTWVYHGQEKMLFDNGYEDEHFEYLICWVPPQIIPLVDNAIDSDPTQCIEWLSKTTLFFSFIDLLKAEGLFG